MIVPVEKLVYGGDGLARTPEGRTLLLPYTLPGESVEIVDGTSGPGSILQPSPDRVTPGCRHFGPCGGCQYQHASYPAQLAAKRAILNESLTRAGLSALPEIVTHAAEPWLYRNRIRLRLEHTGDTIRYGYNLRGTKQFLPISECPISAPLLPTAADALIQLASEDPATARLLQSAAELELSTTPDQSSLQIAVFFRSPIAPEPFAAMCEKLRVRIPALSGAGALLALPNKPAHTARELAAWGKPGLLYPAAGNEFWISRGGFFQVNRFLLDTLVRLVLAHTAESPEDLAWDLFAGVGLFSRALAPHFARITAVEANPAAMRDLSAARVSNISAVNQPVLPFLERAVLERDRPSFVVLDPPRAGIGLPACALLARLAPPRIAYVSCDPTTLARDLRAMVDSGYNLVELHLVDLFPQTFHLETVALLQR